MHLQIENNNKLLDVILSDYYDDCLIIVTDHDKDLSLPFRLNKENLEQLKELLK